MNKKLALVLANCLVLALVGCGTTEEKTAQQDQPPATVDDRTAQNNQTSAQTQPINEVDQVQQRNLDEENNALKTQGLGQGETVRLDPLDDEQSYIAQNQTVYFDFDKSFIRSDMERIIAEHAQYLSEHPSATVLLEGHCDERGTREYNIALGERRAGAVRKTLVLQGAYADQIKMISYGEEKPVDTGHNEAAWAKNRRVDFKYQR